MGMCGIRTLYSGLCMQEVAVPPAKQEDAAAAAEHKMQGDVAFRAGLYEAR